MGAVLGIAAYGRTQEKLGGASTATTTVTAPAAPAPSFGTPSFASAPAQAPAFGSSTGSVAPGFGAVPPAPVQDPAYAQSPFGGPSKMRAPKSQDNPDA